MRLKQLLLQGELLLSVLLLLLGKLRLLRLLLRRRPARGRSGRAHRGGGGVFLVRTLGERCNTARATSDSVELITAHGRQQGSWSWRAPARDRRSLNDGGLAIAIIVRVPREVVGARPDDRGRRGRRAVLLSYDSVLATHTLAG